eukprot:COSAG01_NODE_43867_length_425_cov_0.941718_2_plen_42_part_01
MLAVLTPTATQWGIGHAKSKGMRKVPTVDVLSMPPVSLSEGA